ncbi:MAG: VOC family protein [Bacteroidales bacterium]|nr:VOC family protein [Bacteroidales bacterium]
MKFHSSVLFVEDIEKSKDFYVRILEQEIEHDFGKNVIFKGGLSIWEVQIEHIIKEQLNVKGDSNRLELYFETEQIEENLTKLESENLEFLHGIHEEAWGQRSIRFFDHDQHLIEIGETMETFIKNMHQNGLSIKQISEKSGISIDAIKLIV